MFCTEMHLVITVVLIYLDGQNNVHKSRGASDKSGLRGKMGGRRAGGWVSEELHPRGGEHPIIRITVHFVTNCALLITGCQSTRNFASPLSK